MCIGASRSLVGTVVKSVHSFMITTVAWVMPFGGVGQGDLVSDPIVVLILLSKIHREFLNMFLLLGNSITFFKWNICNYLTESSPLQLKKNPSFIFTFSPSHPFHSFIHFLHLFSKYLLNHLYLPDTVSGTGDTEIYSTLRQTSK